MIKVGLIGAGKMGISHLAILGAHPGVSIAGVMDKSTLVTDVLQRYSSFSCFDDHLHMLDISKPDAVVVAVPTKYHTAVVEDLLHRNIHVFVEKPFSLDIHKGRNLVDLVEQKNLVNQVGYHNQFIGTFIEAKRLLANGALGVVKHFSGNMNGPVVLKPKQGTWRSKPEEGGGCLFDYAAHLIDLINQLIDPISIVHGSITKTYFDGPVEDAVYALVETGKGVSGTMQVNWSDETYRKMATELTVLGSNGKMVVDSTELKLFLRKPIEDTAYETGWNIKHINTLTQPANYFLRGEEYSNQLDYFIDSIASHKMNTINNFATAWQTDKVIHLIKNQQNNNNGTDSIWG
jgi:predicted dehydrogenase